MLTLGVGLEASYGARSALLLVSPRHRHLLGPQVGRASVGGRALSAWPVGTLSVSTHLASPHTTESNEHQLSTPREGGLAWVFHPAPSTGRQVHACKSAHPSA